MLMSTGLASKNRIVCKVQCLMLVRDEGLLVWCYCMLTTFLLHSL